jgi:hypothetical protein
VRRAEAGLVGDRFEGVRHHAIDARRSVVIGPPWLLIVEACLMVDSLRSEVGQSWRAIG